MKLGILLAFAGLLLAIAANGNFIFFYNLRFSFRKDYLREQEAHEYNRWGMRDTQLDFRVLYSDEGKSLLEV